MAFDPDAYLSGGTAVKEFDPDAYLAGDTELPEVVATEGGGGFLEKINAALRKPSPAWLQAPEQAARELVIEQVPHDLPTYLKSILGPAGTAFETGQALAQGDVSGIPLVGRVPEIMAAEETPAFSKERYKTALKTLMDVGALAGAVEGPRVPLRAEPLVPEPPPTQRMGPGTIAGDVSRALDRRFTLQEPPPEAPPQFAPAPPVEDMLANVPKEPPVFNPELGPQTIPEFQMPLRTESAVTPGARPLTPGAAKQLRKLKAHKAQVEAIGGKVDPDKVTARIAEIEGVPPEAPVQAQEAPSIASEALGGVPVAEDANAQLNRILGTEGKISEADLPSAAEPPPPGAGAPPEVPPSERGYAGMEPLPQKPSKIGQSIEAKAVEAKLTRGFPETAGYDPITIKDQAARASDLVKQNPSRAGAIVRGEEPLPPEIKGTSLITAVEEHLVRNPDPQLAYELANSRLVSLTSEAAQEMRLMSERVPDGITAKFAEIKAAREEGAALRKETKAKVKKEINGEVVKAASKRPTWEQFVKEIVC